MSVHYNTKQKIDIAEDNTDENDDFSFPCTACGQCCRNVHLSPLTEYLSRGDGVCQYLDEQTNLCRIYNDRPLVCNTKDFFKVYLKHQITWASYIKQNLSICQILSSN